jgi:hypothetical protein
MAVGWFDYLRRTWGWAAKPATARIDVSQVDLIEAVLLRLQTFLDLDDRHCYLVARSQDAPLAPPGGDFWATVAISGGMFSEEEQDYKQCTEDCEVAVAAYTRIKLDSTNHDEQLLLDASRGLIAIKRKLLRALVGHDLIHGTPVDEYSDTMLRWICHARQASAPDIVEIGNEGVLWGRIEVTFGVPFDWNLD